jgi:hypothetical protein
MHLILVRAHSVRIVRTVGYCFSRSIVYIPMAVFQSIAFRLKFALLLSTGFLFLLHSTSAALFHCLSLFAAGTPSAPSVGRRSESFVSFPVSALSTRHSRGKPGPVHSFYHPERYAAVPVFRRPASVVPDAPRLPLRLGWFFLVLGCWCLWYLLFRLFL